MMPAASNGIQFLFSLFGCAVASLFFVFEGKRLKSFRDSWQILLSKLKRSRQHRRDYTELKEPQTAIMLLIIMSS